MLYASETFSGDDSVTALQQDIETLSHQLQPTQPAKTMPAEMVDIESELTCLRSMFDAYAKGAMLASRDLAQHGPELLEHMRIKLHKAGRVMGARDSRVPAQLGRSSTAAMRELQAATQAVTQAMEQFQAVFAA